MAFTAAANNPGWLPFGLCALKVGTCELANGFASLPRLMQVCSNNCLATGQKPNAKNDDQFGGEGLPVKSEPVLHKTCESQQHHQESV